MLGAVIMKLKAGSGFKHLNNRDLSSFMRDWDDNAIFEYPGDISMSGKHHGVENIKKWWEKFFVQFPKSRFTCNKILIKNCFALGPSNEIALDWSVVTVNKEQKKFTNTGVSLIQIRRGKIVYFKDYFFSTNNLSEAWGEDR